MRTSWGTPACSVSGQPPSRQGWAVGLGLARDWEREGSSGLGLEMAARGGGGGEGGFFGFELGDDVGGGRGGSGEIGTGGGPEAAARVEVVLLEGGWRSGAVWRWRISPLTPALSPLGRGGGLEAGLNVSGEAV